MVTDNEWAMDATGYEHRRRAVWVLLIAYLSGCGGGQSGTDTDTTISCTDEETVEVGTDERVNETYTVEDVIDSAHRAARTLRGRWLSTGEPTELTFEVTGTTTARRTSLVRERMICSSTFEIDATLLVRTTDGVVDAEVPATISAAAPWYTASIEAALPVPDDHQGPPVWPPDGTKARQILGLGETGILPYTTPTFRASGRMDEPSDYVTAAIVDHSDVVGFWSDNRGYRVSGPPDGFVASGELADACDGAEEFQSPPFELPPFASTDEARQALAGTWIRCLDNAPTAHVGIQIDEDGSWRHLELEDGELVARPGFEREGYVGLFPLMADVKGSFQFWLGPFGRRFDSEFNTSGDWSTWASERALVFLSDVVEWKPAVYLPSTLPVRAVAPEFAAGERAGSAACDVGEQGIVSTIEETAELLRGEFVLCSGGLTDGMSALRFDGSDVELLDAEGELIARKSFRIDEFNLPLITVVIGTRQLSLAVSVHPLKLWMQEADDDWHYAPKAVFSALPE